MMRGLLFLLVAIFMFVLLERVSADKDTSSDSGYFEIKGDSEEDDKTANEPDSVLGYLFKEALRQMGAQGQRADNTVSASESGDYDHEYFDAQETFLADGAEHHSATKQQGLIERLFGGDSASSSGNGPDDPVFNFIMTYSALALLAQAFITPYGFVSGKKKKRHTSDG